MPDEQEGQDLEKLKKDLLEKYMRPKPAQRRHTPIHHRGTMKVQAPSRLADLDGSRRPGGEVRVSLGQSKAPKRLFLPGDRFEFEGAEWELLYMYRLRDQPNVWLHVLAERGKRGERLIDVVVDVLGGGSTTERIVFTPFASYSDATQYFWDIPTKGDTIVRTTQQLMTLKRVTDQKQLPE